MTNPFEISALFLAGFLASFLIKKKDTRRALQLITGFLFVMWTAGVVAWMLP